MAGKGDKPRPVDREKWENAEYWKRLAGKAQAVLATKKEK